MSESYSNDYQKFLRAKEVSHDPEVETCDLLNALAKIVDYDKTPALMERDLGHLESDPVALLAVPPDNPNDPYTIAAATLDGRLALTTVDSKQQQDKPAIRYRGPLAGFEPFRDRILGLYWTRSADPFANNRELLVVAQINAKAKVFRFNPDNENPPNIGDVVPEWMRVCPVGAPLDIDLLEKQPTKHIRPPASSAAYRNGQFWTAHPYPTGKNCLEGESVQWLGDDLVLTHRNQKIVCYKILEPKNDNLDERNYEQKWSWYLAHHQPVSICPIPSEDRNRLMIGLETGLLCVAVVLNKNELTDTWNKLVKRIADRENLNSIDSWLDWGKTSIQEYTGPIKRKNAKIIVTILCIIFDELVKKDVKDKGPLDIMTECCQVELGHEDFTPLTRRACYRIRHGRTKFQFSGTQVVYTVYQQFPFESQDYIDQAVQKLLLSVKGVQAEYEAVLESLGDFFKDSLVTRTAYLKNQAKPTANKGAILLDAWLQEFELAYAKPSPQRDGGWMRMLPSHGAILLAHKKALYHLSCDGEPEFHPLQSDEDWVQPQIRLLTQENSQGVQRLFIAAPKEAVCYELNTDISAGIRLGEFSQQKHQGIMHAAYPESGMVLLLVSSSGARELWLWSLQKRQVVGKMAWLHRIPREFDAVAIRLGARWALAFDSDDQDISVIWVTFNKATHELKASKELKRQIRGRIRSLAVQAWDPVQRRIIVGTTEGFILCLDISQNEPSLTFSWLYRTAGSIRHLAACTTGKSFMVMAYTAYGNALVLDGAGKRRWQRNFDTVMRSGTLVTNGEAVYLGLVDIYGVAYVFSKTDPVSSRKEACKNLKGLGSEKEWKKGKRAYLEQIQTMHRLFNTKEEINPDLSSIGARACVLKKLADELERGDRSNGYQNWFSKLLINVRLNELDILARVTPHPNNQDICKEVLELVVNEIHARMEQRDAQPTNAAGIRIHVEAANLMADIIRGFARDILNPAKLGSADYSLWHQVPLLLREDPGVLMSMFKIDVQDRDPYARYSHLVEQATFLGPKSFEILPIIAPTECLEMAQAFSRQVEELANPTEGLSNIRIAIPPLAGGAQLVARLFELLFQEVLSWDVLLRLAAIADNLEKSTRIHSGMRWLVGQIAHFKDVPTSLDLPLSNHLRALYDINLEEISNVPEDAGIWRDWLGSARQHVKQMLQKAITQRSTKLEDITRLSLEDFHVEWTSGKFGKLVARVLREGDRRPDLLFSLTLVKPGDGFTSADNDNREWDWDGVHENLEWYGHIDESFEEIQLKAVTIAGNYHHEYLWKTKIPARDKSRSALFEELSHTRKVVCDPLLKLKSGFHILAVDRLLGFEDIVAHLIDFGGTRTINFDRIFTEDTFLRTKNIMKFIGAEMKSGAWNVSKKGPRKRVLLYPSERAANHLLKLDSITLLNSFKEAIQGLSGLPILWILPLKIAGQLSAKMEGLLDYHPLYLLEEKRRASEDIERWISESRIPKPMARNAYGIFGGNLHLLYAWVRQEREPQVSAQLFLDQSKGLLVELAGLGPLEIFDLILTVKGKVRLPLRQVRPGMIASRDFKSTVKGKKAPTNIIFSGEIITKQVIRSMQSDHHPPDFVWVRGLVPGGSSYDVPKTLIPALRITNRNKDLLKKSYEIMTQRGLVRHVDDVYMAERPYQRWVEARLEEDSTGRTFVEELLDKDLTQSLDLIELAAADDSLPELLPHLGRSSVNLIREIGKVYGSNGTAQDLEPFLSRLTNNHAHPIDESCEEWGLCSDLRAIFKRGITRNETFPIYRIREPGNNHLYLIGYLQSFHRDLISDFQATLAGYQESLKKDNEAEKKVALSLFGPGLVDDFTVPNDFLCLLTEGILKKVVTDGNPPGAYRRAVRQRIGLVSFSPFQVAAWLPENSPVFVGRTREIRQILKGIDTKSYLILGGRRIGKTSLLRHVYGRVKETGSYTPIWLDCASLYTTNDFLSGLITACKDAKLPVKEDIRPQVMIEQTLCSFDKPVLFLNEVDGLINDARDLMWRLRTLSEGNKCQVVMVGYHTVFLGLKKTDSPFFNWVQGKAGEKAFILGALGDVESRLLISKLGDEPLALQWENEETKQEAIIKIYKSSHGIPFLLQQACQKIVEKLDPERRTTIQAEDVRSELSMSMNPVWQYLQETRPSVFGNEAKDESVPMEISWSDLTMTALARQLFLKPLRTTKNPGDDSRNFSFSVLDAKKAVDKFAVEYLEPAEATRVKRVFRAEDYQKLLDVLSLTVLIAPAIGGERSFYFRDCIYPIELKRFLERSKMNIEDYLINRISDLNEYLTLREEEGAFNE